MKFKYSSEVVKVDQLISDCSYRWIFGLPEHVVPQSAILQECKRWGIPVTIEVTVPEHPRIKELLRTFTTD